jgi:ribosome recycling factor
MYKELIESKKTSLEQALDYLNTDLTQLRTGRANPALVENLMVDYYGTRTPLKQIATINAPEARLILIQPWDKDSLVNIEAAIRESNLGLNPANDGQVIRLNIPPLSEERRQEMVKTLNQKAEAARITIRNIREEIWETIQEKTKEGKISEDDKFRGKDSLQEVIDSFNKKIEDIRDKKEKEITTI